MAQPPAQQTHLQEAAYHALNSYFNAHPNEVLEIEILPPSHEPTNALLLQDDTCLGLPKKILVLAFLHARSLFFATKHSTTTDIPDSTGNSNLEALEATRVILLFDPEHLTAANYRKHHLRSITQHEQRCTYAQAELCFLDSILTSPLHRQSKSPTLWALRAHVLEYLLPERNPGLQTSLETRPAVHVTVARELKAVCKSGERHPKNYYAWLYARRMFWRVYSSELMDEVAWVAVVVQCVDTVKKWCCSHPSDISGWIFLAWLLRFAGEQTRIGVVSEVVEYAVSVRLANESLWVFVRTVLADGSIGRRVVEKIVGRLRGVEEERARAREIPVFMEQVSKTLAWVKKYGETDGSGSCERT